ncbi:TonB-dependent receptor [Bacteroidia bacterium]|nr:TonB-dependent receptor [Bacteroidia bacterium]
MKLAHKKIIIPVHNRLQGEAAVYGHKKVPQGLHFINRGLQPTVIIALLLSISTISLFAQQQEVTDSITEDYERHLDEFQFVKRAPGMIKLRSSIFDSQKLTKQELQKAACCNLSESFETNPSVDVSYSDAATGAKQIKLLGLSGSYVQMLAENVPTLRGIAAPYGLGYTPGPWMESIQVSKGTSSVLNGYEALTGQINVVYLQPNKEEPLGLNVYASDARRFEANANASVSINDNLSTILLAHVDNDTHEWDMNDDGFLDQPKVKQYNVLNKWDYRNDNFMSYSLLRYLHEDRDGGQIADPYKIGITTNRYEFYTRNGIILNSEKESSIGLAISGSQHEQDALYGRKTYNANQSNLYANLIFATNLNESSKLSAGASYNLDKYEEGIAGQARNDKQEDVPGVFGEYSWNWKDKIIVLAGLRGDYSSRYGYFLTPRLHTKFNFSEAFYMRASVGKGYRSPNVWAENSYLLASNRDIVVNDNGEMLKQEEAWNYGVNVTAHIPLFNKELTLNGEFYRTDFNNQVVTDLDSDPHKAIIGNLDGKSYANSMQLEASYELLRGWTLTAAHRIIDSKTTIGGKLREKPLTNRYKSLLTTSYQTRLKKWQFDFTTQLNGGGRLPDPDSANPLWDKEFDAYPILNAQVTKFFRGWSVYLGAENLTNFKQKHPIIDATKPNGTDFDASMVWGPIDGRRIYIGARWNLAL